MKLITDRNKDNVYRLGELSKKRWDSMTPSERAEWSGDPMTADDFGYGGAVNILPPRGVGVTIRDGSIIATGTGTITIGPSTYFAGNAVTLSAEYVSPVGELSLEWSNGGSAGCVLDAAGSVTETLTAASNAVLRMKVSPGYYGKVMLELGRVQHAYVPYTEILPTEATKGAYNFSDLNRVERAVKDIAEILGLPIVTKTDWTVWDIPTKPDLKRYLDNIRLIQSVCGETTVLTGTMTNMTHTTANEIEAVLLRCRDIAEASIRCGELICGEVI